MNEETRKAIGCRLFALSELISVDVSATKIRAYEDILAPYGKDKVFRAIERVSRTHKFRTFPLPADFIEAIEAENPDGFLSGNEAWAKALGLSDESKSAVICPEILEAWSACRAIFQSGDEVGARVCFRDAYDRAVARAKERGGLARWYLSEGFDPEHRAAVAREAVEQGILPRAAVSNLLQQDTTAEGRALISMVAGAEQPTENLKPVFLAKLRKLREDLEEKGRIRDEQQRRMKDEELRQEIAQIRDRKEKLKSDLQKKLSSALTE